MEGGYFRYIFQPFHGLSEGKFKLALVGLDILGKDDNFETRTDLQICPLAPFLSSLGHPRRHIPKYYMYRGYLEELIRLVCPGLELIFMHFHQSFWSGCTGWYFLSRETKSLHHLLNIFTRNIHAASRTRTCDLEAAMDSKPNALSIAQPRSARSLRLFRKPWCCQHGPSWKDFTKTLRK